MATTAYIAASDLTGTHGYLIQQILSGDSNYADGADVSADAKLLDAIETANARVDASIFGRYDPDDVKTDASLMDAAMSIAIYTLVKRYRRELIDAHQPQYDSAIQYLRDIQKGSSKGGVDLAYPPTHRDESNRAPVAVTIGFDVTNSDAQGFTNSAAFSKF